MTIPNKTFLDGIHRYQLDALRAFDSGAYQYFMTEWGRRHRKTTLWLNVAIREACKFPNCAFGHILPLQTEARSVIWDSPDMLRRYLPDRREMNWKMNEQKMLVTFENGSILKIGGADEPDSWRGIEFIGVIFDEAKWIKEAMWTTIILPVMKGPLPKEKLDMGVRRWAAFAYTPEGNSWATRMFDDACMLHEGGELPDCGRSRLLRPGYYASRLDAEKAGIVSAQSLAEAKRDMPRAMYDQEMRCARITNEDMTLITSKSLDDLKVLYKPSMKPKRRIISVDPALGGDKCAMKYIEDGEVIDKKDCRTNDSKVVIGEAVLFSAKHHCDNFIVDVIGLGGPIADALSEAGKVVNRFNSSEQAGDNKRFANKKAELWWYVMEQVNQGNVPYPSDPEIARQVPAATQYVVVSSGGKIRMRLKDDIRQILGCSPDDADSWGYGIWGLQFVEPDLEVRGTHNKGYSYACSGVG